MSTDNTMHTHKLIVSQQFPAWIKLEIDTTKRRARRVGELVKEVIYAGKDSEDS